MRPNFIYRSPVLYKAMLQLVHGKHLKKRYQQIAEELDGAGSVFEPLCGPALLPKFLDEGTSYSGFDINPRFVKYAQKKGHKVWEGDARNAEAYQVQADGAVLVDALHHIQPYLEQQKVVERSAEAADKKLVICEPFGDRYFAMIKKFPFLRKLAEWAYNWIERDGSNQVRFSEIRSKSQLEDMMDDGFGVLKGVEKKIRQIGPEDLIVTYYL